HDAERVEAALRLPPNARTLVNPAHEKGQSTSLVAGLRNADPASEGAVVLLADQPGITADHVHALVETFREGHPRIARLRFRDGPGPALLAREVWREAMDIEGDLGARALIAAHPDWVQEVVINEDAPPDVDTPADLARFEI